MNIYAIYEAIWHCYILVLYNMIQASYIACYTTPVLSHHCSILGRFLARFLGSVCEVIWPALLSATLQSLCSPLASTSNASLSLLLAGPQRCFHCYSACLPPAMMPQAHKACCHCLPLCCSQAVSATAAWRQPNLNKVIGQGQQIGEPPGKWILPVDHIMMLCNMLHSMLCNMLYSIIYSMLGSIGYNET